MFGIEEIKKDIEALKIRIAESEANFAKSLNAVQMEKRNPAEISEVRMEIAGVAESYAKLQKRLEDMELRIVALETKKKKSSAVAKSE